jgi:outer membrane lipoprotein carrier protein
VIISSSWASAQSAAVIAAKVDAHYNHLHSLRAGFVESFEGLGIERTERGTLLLAKPGRMKWVYAAPKGKLFVLDGKYAWSYAEGDAQVQRVSAAKLDDLRSPLRFLLGHTQLEKELVGLTARPVDGGLFAIEGKPRADGKNASIAAIRMRVTAQGVIRQIEIEQMDGSLTRFEFTNEEVDVKLSDGEFKFIVPNGVPVVDALPPI